MAKIYDLTSALQPQGSQRRRHGEQGRPERCGPQVPGPAPFPLRRGQGFPGATTPISGATLFKPSTRARGIRAIAAIGLLSLGAATVSFAAAPQRTLVDLVREGKRESVLAAITSPDVDVNEKAPDGSTSLMWAAFNDDLELVRALLKAGAKANVTSNYRRHRTRRGDQARRRADCSARCSMPAPTSNRPTSTSRRH